MKKKSYNFFKVILAFFFVFEVFPCAYAQEKDPGEFTLEEITVTAEKREVNVQKTAMSVTAISGDEMSSKAINSLDDALRNLAGVNILAQAGGGNVFIRGVGSGLDTNLADPSVSINVDSVYVARHESMASSMFDVERVEVLRGPQGTMYGRNAAGGQINVLTRRPTHTFETNATMTMGNFKLKNFTTMVNVPLAEKWAARVALYKDDRDGYVSDGSDSSDKFSTRVKVSYNAMDALSFLYTVEYTHDMGSPATTTPAPNSKGHLPTFLPWTVPDTNYDGRADDLLNANGTKVTGGNGIPDIVDLGWQQPGGNAWVQDIYHWKPLQNNKFLYSSLEINWDMGWTQLYLLPAINKNQRSLWSDLVSGTSQGNPAGSNEQSYKETQYTMEARLSNGADSPFTWLVGFYYLDSSNKDNNKNAVSLEPLESSQAAGGNRWVSKTYRQPNTMMAYFAQATYPLIEQFRITGGIRKTIDARKMNYRFANYNITSTTDPFYNLATVIDGRHQYDSGIIEDKQNFDNVSWKLGLEYDVNEDSMLYATLSTGYKGGGLNLQGSVPPKPYDPEELLSYSIGSKNRFLGNQLQLNVEAYYYDYKGYQIQDSVPYVNYLGVTVNAQMIKNADKGHNMGLEIETDYMFTANDRVRVSAAYMDTEFGYITLGANALAGTTTPTVLEGAKMTQAPGLSGTLGYEHTWILENGDSIKSSLSTKISQGYWTTEKHFYAGAWQKPYHMSEFYLNYNFVGGKYSVNFWGKNLENTVVCTRMFPLYRQFISAPRTTGITFTANFK